VFSLLSPAANALCRVFHLLNYVIPEVLPAWLVGSASASGKSVLEPADIGSVGHQGSLQQLLAEGPPGYQNLTTQTQYSTLLLQFGRGQQQKDHAVTLLPLPSLKWGGEWNKKDKKLMCRDKGSLTEQRTKRTVTRTVLITWKTIHFKLCNTFKHIV